MTTRKWTFLLAIKGTHPERMAMIDCADYIRAFARLLGNTQEVHMAGVFKNSVDLRAYAEPQVETDARVRLLAAKTAPDSDAARVARELLNRLAGDSLRAVVKDQRGESLLELSPPTQAKTPDEPTISLADEAVIDGVVVGIVGADDTAHLTLRDFDDSPPYRITIRRLDDARALAARWRGAVIRCRVHGTWTREASGRWSPKDLVLRGFEDLEQLPPLEVMERLRAIPDNGWLDVDDSDALLRDLRT